MSLPTTPLTLLAKLKNSADIRLWDASWKRFHELYHQPILLMVRSAYRSRSGGMEPSTSFIEEAAAAVISDFSGRSHQRYDPSKGRLRTYLRVIVNARVVDMLREEQPLNRRDLDDAAFIDDLIDDSFEKRAFFQSLLASLIEDLRCQIPLRQFEIFERVKLEFQAPDEVARDLGIKRARVDREIHKAKTRLEEIASSIDYQEEFADLIGRSGR
jgi:RNA polymerase sigma factor (sigma-70 family)